MLTQATIKNTKPADKPYKLSDKQGLYVQIHPNGSKYWRWKYYYLGKESVFSFGIFPEVSLAEVREKHQEMRKLLRSGINPSDIRREKKRLQDAEAVNTFAKLAAEWFEVKRSGWSDYYCTQLEQRLQKDILPKLGRLTPDSVQARDVLEMARSIEERGAHEMAHRAIQYCSKIFQYGIITDRCNLNPAAMLRGALKPVPKTEHHAYLDKRDLPGFIADLESYDGGDQTKLAIRLLMHTFVRTAELCEARWTEIDFENREWKIPAARMKMGTAHVVPLSDEAFKIFETLRRLNGHREFVFPGSRSWRKPMSTNAMLFAIYAMGYKGKMTGHGFRATASTILNESGLFPKDVIERQLAHQERNRVRAAYDHAEHLPARREMMRWWSHYLKEIGVKNADAVV